MIEFFEDCRLPIADCRLLIEEGNSRQPVAPCRLPRLCVALLLGLSLCLARPLNVSATCNCASEDLQIAFVLDCSGSMNHTLSTLQEQIKRIIEVKSGESPDGQQPQDEE